MIRLHLVGVQLLGGRVDVRQIGRVAPVEKVGGGRGPDRADAAALSGVGEESPVSAIRSALRVPKGEVLRVERPIRDDRTIAHGRPVQAVWRLEREQPVRLRRADERLVAGVGGGGRVIVPEHGGVAGVDVERSPGSTGEDDVVVLRAPELDQAERGLPPMDPVLALGVTTVERMSVGSDLPRRDIEVPGLVIHPVEASVLENAVVAAATPFPRLIMDKHNLSGLRMMQPKVGLPREAVDQKVVEKQLAAGADRQGRYRVGGQKLPRRIPSPECSGERGSRRAGQEQTTGERPVFWERHRVDLRWFSRRYGGSATADQACCSAGPASEVFSVHHVNPSI